MARCHCGPAAIPLRSAPRQAVDEAARRAMPGDRIMLADTRSGIAACVLRHRVEVSVCDSGAVMAAGQDTIERIDAAPRAGDIGIVHLGLGAFHRAHQAVYLERLRQLTGDTGWGVASANLRANVALVDALAGADHRYHVAESAGGGHLTLREIGVIEAVYFTGRLKGRWGRDRAALLDRLADPAVRIVTLTVTEKGYGLDSARGELRLDDPAIAHDIAHPDAPRSAPGILCAALARRRAAGLAGFTVLCCDNMPANGVRTKTAVVSLAGRIAPDLARWIDATVAFPSSMVDRIVPAATDTDRAQLADRGVADANVVVCEAFSQWVIEDDFPLGRPDWERVGVQMVADVTPLETMKLRLLNGAHSLLAYLASLAGIETVAEAVARDDIAAFIERYMRDEAAPTLDLPAGVDVVDYRARLLARFNNDRLAHRLHQIAADGSQKLPQRWLAGTAANLEAQRPVACVALGVAGWIRYTAGTDLVGGRHRLDDPMAERLVARHAEHGNDIDALIAAFLADREIFDARVADAPGFASAVARAYRLLVDHGLAAAMAAGPGN